MTPDSVSSTVCSQCGKSLLADSTFCDQCGHKAEKVAPVPVTSTAHVKVLEDEVEAEHGQVTPADAKHAEKLLERASNLLQKGDYQGATVACRQSLSLVQSAAGYLLLSNILRAQGNADGARHAMEHARALVGEDSGLLQQVDSQATRLTAPTAGTVPAPLTASLDTPLPPVIPQAVPTVAQPPIQERTAFVAAIEPSVQGTPSTKPAGMATWKYALALVAGFFLTFFIVAAIRRGAAPPLPEPVVEPTTIPAIPQDNPDVEAPPPPQDGAPANTDDGQITSPAPDSGPPDGDQPPAAAAPPPAAPRPTHPAVSNPGPVNRTPPRNRPAAPPPANDVQPLPNDARSGTSSGNGMLRVPSELPTPAAVDSPQVPTIRTPR